MTDTVLSCWSQGLALVQRSLPVITMVCSTSLCSTEVHENSLSAC